MCAWFKVEAACSGAHCSCEAVGSACAAVLVSKFSKLMRPTANQFKDHRSPLVTPDQLTVRQMKVVGPLSSRPGSVWKREGSCC